MRNIRNERQKIAVAPGGEDHRPTPLRYSRQWPHRLALSYVRIAQTFSPLSPVTPGRPEFSVPLPRYDFIKLCAHQNAQFTTRQFLMTRVSSSFLTKASFT